MLLLMTVTLGKLLNLSVPQFSHVYNEDNNSFYFIGLLLMNDCMNTHHDYGKHSNMLANFPSWRAEAAKGVWEGHGEGAGLRS